MTMVAYVLGKEYVCTTMENWTVGNKVTIVSDNGVFERKVYDSKDGMCVRLNGTTLFYEDFN